MKKMKNQIILYLIKNTRLNIFESIGESLTFIAIGDPLPKDCGDDFSSSLLKKLLEDVKNKKSIMLKEEDIQFIQNNLDGKHWKNISIFDISKYIFQIY